jgi:DNA-binding transcriptional MocR family regulator
VQGQLEHREAGAAWLRELGVDVAAEDVYAVSGGQTALMSIFLGLATPGDTVLTEVLTWPGALSVGRLTGIRLMPLAIDRKGMVPDAFETACQTLRPRLVYTMPTLHNPTNATAGLGPAPRDRADRARQQCVDCRGRRLWFPDRAASDPYFHRARDRTVYLTSLSKSIAPAGPASRLHERAAAAAQRNACGDAGNHDHGIAGVAGTRR